MIRKSSLTIHNDEKRIHSQTFQLQVEICLSMDQGNRTHTCKDQTQALDVSYRESTTEENQGYTHERATMV